MDFADFQVFSKKLIPLLLISFCLERSQNRSALAVPVKNSPSLSSSPHHEHRMAENGNNQNIVTPKTIQEPFVPSVESHNNLPHQLEQGQVNHFFEPLAGMSEEMPVSDGSPADPKASIPKQMSTLDKNTGVPLPNTPKVMARTDGNSFQPITKSTEDTQMGSKSPPEAGDMVFREMFRERHLLGPHSSIRNYITPINKSPLQKQPWFAGKMFGKSEEMSTWDRYPFTRLSSIPNKMSTMDKSPLQTKVHFPKEMSETDKFPHELVFNKAQETSTENEKSFMPVDPFNVPEGMSTDLENPISSSGVAESNKLSLKSTSPSKSKYRDSTKTHELKITPSKIMSETDETNFVKDDDVSSPSHVMVSSNGVEYEKQNEQIQTTMDKDFDEINLVHLSHQDKNYVTDSALKNPLHADDLNDGSKETKFLGKGTHDEITFDKIGKQVDASHSMGDDSVAMSNEKYMARTILADLVAKTEEILKRLKIIPSPDSLIPQLNSRVKFSESFRNEMDQKQKTHMGKLTSVPLQSDISSIQTDGTHEKLGKQSTDEYKHEYINTRRLQSVFMGNLNANYNNNNNNNKNDNNNDENNSNNNNKSKDENNNNNLASESYPMNTGKPFTFYFVSKFRTDVLQKALNFLLFENTRNALEMVLHGTDMNNRLSYRQSQVFAKTAPETTAKEAAEASDTAATVAVAAATEQNDDFQQHRPATSPNSKYFAVSVLHGRDTDQTKNGSSKRILSVLTSLAKKYSFRDNSDDEIFDKRGRSRSCNVDRVTLEMLIEFFTSGKICGVRVIRVRFGMGRR